MEERRSILLGRTSMGFGDWVMFSSIILGINKQKPNVDVYLTKLDQNPYYKFMDDCGCKYKLIKSDEIGTINFDGTQDHVIYHSHVTGHLFLNMVMNLNHAIPWLNLNPFDCPPAIPIVSNRKVEVNNRYFIVPSDCNGYVSSTPKIFYGWNELIQGIKNKFNIPCIELSSNKDIVKKQFKESTAMVNCADNYKLSTELIENAEFVVSLENGLSHFTGQIGTTCFTIYNNINCYGKAKPENAWWPGQVPVYVGYGNPTASDVINAIDKWYKDNKIIKTIKQ